jgi:hypothetical protein
MFVLTNQPFLFEMRKSELVGLMLFQALTAPHNIFTNMRTKAIHCGMLLVIGMLAMCGRVYAQSCGGRPSDNDLLTVRDLVAEQITDDHFWFGERSISNPRIDLNLRVAANPVAEQDGANVLVTVPLVGIVSLWRVCGQDFAFVSAQKYSSAMTAVDLAKVDEQYRQFSANAAVKNVNLTMSLREMPDFKEINTGKADLLSKIQRTLICFMYQNEPLRDVKTLQLRVGDFTEKSLKVPVEIVGRDQLWIMTLQLNSAGIASNAIVGTAEKFRSASPLLKNRLQDHSIFARVDVASMACRRGAQR